MNNTYDLSNYTVREYNARISEYVFDTRKEAQNFIDEWRDKVGVDEFIWQNDEGTYSVLVNSRG